MEEPIRFSFIFYKSFADALACMEPEEREDALLILFNYCFYWIEPEIDEFSQPVKMFYVTTKPIIDKDIEKYENRKRYSTYQ